ncbi:MAG: tetratricopeptide repeat protein [Pseudobacteriovorax sp.]|nr:tetratricopeptide repeat protein [Pseudobacteriovorax sp.]
MNQLCLLVDCNSDDSHDNFQALVDKEDLVVLPTFVSMEEAFPMLETGNVVAMVVFASQANGDVLRLLECFRRCVGAIPHFQAIVCDEPQPIILSQVYEFGVEEFFSSTSWVQQSLELCKSASLIIQDRDSPETRIIEMNRAVMTGDQNKILAAKERLSDMAGYDYLASYSQGVALQSVGQFGDAIESFRQSTSLNRMFRPSISGVGENLLVLGQTDEAIAVFKDLEKLNKRSLDRKANLAMAYLEKKDLTSAKKYLFEAQALDPKHVKIDEIKAMLLLSQGQVKEAFAMMDKLHDVGPFFAAKLNEMGIRLSQKGKGKSALALYKKAHKIVKTELRHKISLNAALACYRMGEYPLAIKYLNRSDKEYGEAFPKTKKIRAAIAAQMANSNRDSEAG